MEMCQHFIEKQLVPRVLSTSNIDSKDSILTLGIYQNYDKNHGIQEFSETENKSRRLRRHDRRLARLRQLKKAAKRAFV